MPPPPPPTTLVQQLQVKERRIRQDPKLKKLRPRKTKADDGLDTCDDNDQVESTKFQFANQGCWVSVAYDNEWFVGSVCEVMSPYKANVQFLQRGLRNTYRWPSVDDIALVDSTFVFAHHRHMGQHCHEALHLPWAQRLHAAGIISRLLRPPPTRWLASPRTSVY